VYRTFAFLRFYFVLSCCLYLLVEINFFDVSYKFYSVFSLVPDVVLDVGSLSLHHCFIALNVVYRQPDITERHSLLYCLFMMYPVRNLEITTWSRFFFFFVSLFHSISIAILPSCFPCFLVFCFEPS
jgi:hypothetical protein